MKSYDDSITGLFPEDPFCAERKRAMRASLIEVGKSPDCHVYDFDEKFLEGHPSKASIYLRKLKKFYDGLDYFKRRIFVSECLEVGRVYPFWYYGWMSPPCYRKERRSVIDAFKEAFQ